MRSRYILWAFGAIAVGGALVAAYVAGKRSAVAASETVEVLVARRDLPKDARIREPEEAFHRIRYPKGLEPVGALTELEPLRGATVRRALAQGQPVREQDVVLRGSLPRRLDLPEGTQPCLVRALVTLDPTTQAYGSGSRVDVFLHTDKDGPYTCIATDVMILSLGDLRLSDPWPEVTHTLMVTPEQAGKIAEAQKRGSVRLLLRKVE
jgi:Flp pilus assembly protein CpaB